MTAPPHLTAVLAVGVARLSPSNCISADPPNAASIVAIERRPPNVDISGPVSANMVIARRRSNRPGLSRQAGRKRRSATVPPGGPCTKAPRLAHVLLHATHIFGGGPARRCSRDRSALAWA